MNFILKLLLITFLATSMLSCSYECSRQYSLFSKNNNVQMTYNSSSKQLALQGSFTNLNKNTALIKIINQSGQEQSYNAPLQDPGFLYYSIPGVNSTDQICIEENCGNSTGSTQPIYTSICH